MRGIVHGVNSDHDWARNRLTGLSEIIWPGGREDVACPLEKQRVGTVPVLLNYRGVGVRSGVGEFNASAPRSLTQNRVAPATAAGIISTLTTGISSAT